MWEPSFFYYLLKNKIEKIRRRTLKKRSQPALSNAHFMRIKMEFMTRFAIIMQINFCFIFNHSYLIINNNFIVVINCLTLLLFFILLSADKYHLRLKKKIIKNSVLHPLIVFDGKELKYILYSTMSTRFYLKII